MGEFFILLLFLIGLALGSFANAWIWRMRHGESVVVGRSYCPDCGHALAWYHLIPIASFFVLRGRCRYCKKPISPQYPLVESWMGFSFALLGVFHGAITPELARDVVAVFSLTVLFVYDFLYQEIPDAVSLPFIGVFIFLDIVFHFHTGWNMAFGILSGGGLFLLQYIVSGGRWIGGGDIRLGVLMGALLGWPVILLALFLAYVSGALVGIVLLAQKKKGMKSEVPFGVFLAPATVVALLWGQRIVGWYMGMVR